MEKRYDEWMKKFMEGWKHLDWRAVLSVLDKKVEYYENPIDEPCRDFDEVTKLWSVVAENQRDIEYSYEILACDDEKCLINWRMTRTMLPETKQAIDGSFQAAVNGDGKCTFFKQWRFVKQLMA